MRAAPRSSYGWYALAVLMTAYVVAFLDRQILNLLIEPIKRDLGLSDVGISLLQGLFFAAVLSVAGIPIGRLIDTRHRIGLLAIGMAWWSLMTAACGLAAGYGWLLLCRLGVGAGEAVMTPAAYSLIGDYIRRERQGLAMGLYAAAAYVGAGLALLAGGELLAWLPDAAMRLPVLGGLQGWRAAFVVAGLAGLCIAIWVGSLREPARKSGAKAGPSLAEVRSSFARMWREVMAIDLCVACAAMGLYALAAWLPSFFVRHFGMAVADAGRMLGLIVMMAGSAGTLIAGLSGDRLGSISARLAAMGTAAACAAPLVMAAMLAPDAGMSFVLLVPVLGLLAFVIGSGPPALQRLTPGRMRGVQHALAVLVVNLIGLGLGPTLVALATDLWFGDEARLGEALAIMVPAMLLAAAGCGAIGWRVTREVRRDVAYGATPVPD